MHAAIIPDFASPMNSVVIAYLAGTMNPMVITRFCVAAVAS